MDRAEELFAQVERGGVDAVRQLVIARSTESYFLDFKRSANGGTSVGLHDGDRNQLARAISGFGNAEGGVLVWGVDCSRDSDGADVARMLVPLANAARFAAELEHAVSGCTIPAHSSVRSIPIVEPGTTAGYAATLVPKSHRLPHQVVNELKYYMRAGDSFLPVPHAVLAGMFGRAPIPHVFQAFTVAPASIVTGSISVQVGVLVRNNGPGIARDLFANVWVGSSPSASSEIVFQPTSPTHWDGVWSFQQHMSLVAKEHMRLPPEAQVSPLTINMRIATPITSPLVITGMVGAEGCPPSRFRCGAEVGEIEAAMRDCSSPLPAFAEQARMDFGSRILQPR
jgi:hypothetical protein